jgi:hypothetical protein
LKNKTIGGKNAKRNTDKKNELSFRPTRKSNLLEKLKGANLSPEEKKS